MKVHAISLWQPWASLLAHRKKMIETRAWPFPDKPGMPCVLAIHATRSWGKGHTEAEFLAMCSDPDFADLLAECGYERPADLPRGAIVGLGLLDLCVPTATLLDDPRWDPVMTAQEEALGDYSEGRWGWIFARIRRFRTPIPCSGAQGLWTWETPPECDTWINDVLNGDAKDG